jgi:hypothetical protein
MWHLVVVVASLALTTPQAGAGQPGSPGLSVLSTRIEVAADYAADAREQRSAARATSSPEGRGETEGAFDRMDATPASRAGKKYKVSVVVRNDGTRGVRAVTLEYPPGYPRGRRPPERLRFRVRREIKAGETQTLSHYFATTKYVPLSRVGRPAVVVSIEYEDGSVWRR